MATHYTSALTVPSISTTGTRKRTVADKIRRLFPQDAQLLALVASGLDAGEGIVRKKGLISKKKVDNRKFEGFTYTPVAIEFTVTTGGTTTASIADADGLTLKTILVNTTNHTVARVSAISTLALTLTSIGDTSFSSSAGDVLMSMGPAYAENSSSPYLIMKDEDNYYNTTHIFRFPSAISRTAKKIPHYGQKDFWARVRQNVLAEGLRRVEIAMLFGERPASTAETTADGTLNDSFGTFRGLWNWAATTVDFGGNMTWEGFQVDLPNGMHSSVSPSDKKLFVCGEVTFGRMLRWVNDKVTVMESGDYEEFGVFTKKFVTAKGTFDVMVHDAFNHGALAKTAIAFVPEAVQYCHFHDDDLHPMLGIQANDVDGVEDDILGELSFWSEDAGYSATKVTGIW